MRLDEAELVRWGRSIGAAAETPMFIALSGPLGAGKSVLARAIGLGAGVTEPMPSPTYTLVHRYRGGGGRRVVHLDLHRIDSPDELWELGWGHLGDADEIVLVEWPERAGDLLPPDHWRVQLTVPVGGPLLREVEVHRVGAPRLLAPFPMSISR